MQKILSETDLQFVLSESENRRGTIIEMPFLSGNVTYMLTVVLREDSIEPMWTYYRGDDPGARVIWQHPTGDVNLVLNLCAGETGVGEVDYTSTSKATGLPSHMLRPPDQSMMTNTYGSMPSLASLQQQQDTPNPSQSSVTTTNPSLVGKTASLEGDLANMQIPTLLQSINMSKMTGKLHLQDKGQVASIYFNDGNPVHAVTDESIGDAAIVEMITWEEGQFHFYPNEQSTEVTVKKRVDSMLMEGITMLDQNKFLKEQGLTQASFLIRKNPALTEEEFKQILQSKGAPLDMDVQKRFYAQVDGAATMLDMLRRMPMTKLEWVPIMFNMLSCGLIVVSDKPAAGVQVSQILAIPPFPIDRAAIQAVAKTLVRPETGIFTYPAFLYFLEQEFAKCAAMGMPLSVIVFDMWLRVGNDMQPMPLNFANQVLRRMENAKRPFDTLGHFETFGYALFMPNTPAKGAKVFSVRLLELIGQDSGIPRMAGMPAFTMGVSSAPGDTLDLAQLLSAAKEAKKRGMETGTSISLFAESQQR